MKAETGRKLAEASVLAYLTYEGAVPETEIVAHLGHLSVAAITRLRDAGTIKVTDGVVQLRTNAVPYRNVRWQGDHGVGGVQVTIHLVHPDGRSRGLTLVVPDEALFEKGPGEHYVHYFLQPHLVKGG